MISTEYFKIVVEFSPLISIDLVTMYNGKVLLGKRVNKPAKDFYFTTGGIVRKNETFENAKKRIAKGELGIEISQELAFIGVFEHFYDDGIFEGVSTHYVNHGYLLDLNEKLENIPKEQHSSYKWFDIDELLQSNEVHQYVKDYFKQLNIGEDR
ncbi:NUDIX domain-containing protein [Sulfurimonas sp. C5]|uniref:GDP-mannose mannosyl hydrolase n=1 Tax=Sulfurimonas sp. C5 TaxID=3036947 RepID=UPI002457B7F9|nr:NUDIX domain-containing protein [Sulfurimonas sp. C5]MDH4944084.1 NUDIX domain-containing protein [Sulfurimonas sp. C5]